MKSCSGAFAILLVTASTVSLPAQGQVGVGPGGGAPPQITTEQLVTPPTIVWGETSFISATAMGGTAPYQYGLRFSAVGHPNPDQVPFIVMDIDPNGVANYTLNGHTVATINSLIRATDSLGATGDDTELITISAPDSITCVTGLVFVDLTVGEQIVNGTFDFKFRVRSGITEVGAFAVGFAQEKFYSAVLNPTTQQWEPGVALGDWVPAEQPDPNDGGGAFHFATPLIHDVKSFAVTRAEWDSIADGTVLRRVFQKVRLHYPRDTMGQVGMDLVESGLFYQEFKKIDQSRILFTSEPYDPPQ